MVTIIDYGIGNLRSIEKAFETVGVRVHRTDDAEDVASADRLVLPGVGAFRACIDEIRDRDLEAPIHDAIDRGTPFLGVCVGMQLLFDTGKHPAILRDEVTTPGGTAIAAVSSLEQHGLRTMLINAVGTATERSEELNDESQ